MNETPLQLAKREVQQNFSNKTIWVGLLAAGVILGLSGPFETSEALKTAPRLIYWVVMCALFYFLGTWVGTFSSAYISRLGLPEWPSTICAGLCTGLAIFAALLGINIMLFDLPLAAIKGLLGLGVNVVAISTVITCAIVYIKRNVSGAGTETAPVLPQPAPILRRLPMEKRGALVALSVSDHYVQVTTTNGQELLLMRLSDAMDEVGETKGMQVHRSHWVALDQITSAKRDGAKAILTLSAGQDIPASRTYVPALKEAGILPG